MAEIVELKEKKAFKERLNDKKVKIGAAITGTLAIAAVVILKCTEASNTNDYGIRVVDIPEIGKDFSEKQATEWIKFLYDVGERAIIEGLYSDEELDAMASDTIKEMRYK